MTNSLRGWDKGCHGEVKRFADIKTPCFQTTAVSWQLQLLHQRSCMTKNGWRKFWLVSTDWSLGSCQPHAFSVTLAKPPGTRVQKAALPPGQPRWLRDAQSRLTQARQETRLLKGQNSLIRIMPQITANKAENLKDSLQLGEKRQLSPVQRQRDLSCSSSSYCGHPEGTGDPWAYPAHALILAEHTFRPVKGCWHHWRILDYVHRWTANDSRSVLPASPDLLTPPSHPREVCPPGQHQSLKAGGRSEVMHTPHSSTLPSSHCLRDKRDPLRPPGSSYKYTS